MIGVSIDWTVVGTTENLEQILRLVGEGVMSSAKLSSTVHSGTINGKPHSSSTSDGRMTSLYHPGVLWRGEKTGSNIVTSFQFYPEAGLLRFSDPAYPNTYLLARQSHRTAGGSSSLILADWNPQPKELSDWEYDAHLGRHRFWDGSKWLWETWDEH